MAPTDAPAAAPDKIAKPAERTESPNVNFASVVDTDGSKASLAAMDKAKGGDTMAKNGFTAGSTLLAGMETPPSSTPATPAKPATGLDGKACEQQPKQGEVPTLERGVKDSSCGYSDDPKVKQAYDEGVKHTARVNHTDKPDPKETDPEKQTPKEHHGSGLIVGKGKDECYVLTDRHVAKKYDGTNHDSLDATMPNGQRYPAEPRADNPKKDLTVVAVKTGPDTDAVCQPAKIAKDGEPKYGKDNNLKDPDEFRVGVGYPRGAQTPYASPGKVQSSTKMIEYGIYGEATKGEDFLRPIVENGANYTKGQSGGGVFNQKGEATGLMDRNDGRNNSAGYETPISENEVKKMVARSRR